MTIPIPIPISIGNIYPSNGQNGCIYLTDAVSPTLLYGQGVNGRGIGSCNAPKIIEMDYENKDTRLRVEESAKRSCL